jgi:hypothetical protein
MNGNFNSKYVNGALRKLEKRCLTLLCEGYMTAASRKNISIDWDEEDISKELIQCLETNVNKTNWKISVFPEYRIYTDNISAKKSPRIDFCFSCWTFQEWNWFAEAKILIETDSRKTGRQSKISARDLCNRYIETGIDNYLSGWYPANGCLAGYVLQGNIENIINNINQYLQDANKSSEKLMKQSFGLQDFEWCYLSIHENGFVLKHLMFDFACQ